MFIFSIKCMKCILRKLMLNFEFNVGLNVIVFFLVILCVYLFIILYKIF